MWTPAGILGCTENDPEPSNLGRNGNSAGPERTPTGIKLAGRKRPKVLKDFESMASEKRKQKTEKGLEIPVPIKGDFDAALAKAAPPADRKRPDGKDRPQKRSE